MKQIMIRISPNGIIKAETINMQGHECQKYIGSIEQLTGAVSVDSRYLDTFFEKSEVEFSQKDECDIKEDVTGRIKL